MSEKDLEYLATIIFLATRGGAITDVDIDTAYRVSKVVFSKVFGENEPI